MGDTGSVFLPVTIQCKRQLQHEQTDATIQGKLTSVKQLAQMARKRKQHCALEWAGASQRGGAWSVISQDSGGGEEAAAFQVEARRRRDEGSGPGMGNLCSGTVANGMKS